MSISALLGRYLRRLEPRGRWDGFVHTPLDRLPMVAIDCETTNLNPGRDRIVSFAAIRIEEGLKVADRLTLDLLMDPGVDVLARRSRCNRLLTLAP